MDIRSTPSGYSPKTQSGRTRETTPAATTRPGAAPTGPAEDTVVDRVELSNAARELNERLAHGESTGGLSPERIRQLASRMKSGYYDQHSTVNRILEGARSEITRGDSKE